MANYELITLEDGTEARQYADGSIRRPDGRMIKPLPNSEDTRITATSNHRQRRKEKIIEAIEAGVMRVTDAPNPSEAIAMIVSKRAKIAMTDDTRTGNEAAKIVLGAMDAMPERVSETVQTQRHEYTLDEETMRIVERMLALRRGEE